jgi:hypothetical protein
MITTEQLDALGKIVPAAAAVVGAALKVLPSASAAGKKRRPAERDLPNLRVESINAPSPLSPQFYGALKVITREFVEARSMMRTHSRRWC